MNSLVVFVLALAATVCAAPEARVERIMGGTPTTIEEFPYIVALIYTYPAAGITVQRCVGSLLSSWHVLTSGFCYTGAINDNMKVRAGSTSSLSGGVLVSLGEVIIHPGYVGAPRRDDLAVTFLASPLSITNVIDVLFLPPQGSYIPDGHETKVVSWGFEYQGGPQLELLKTITLNKVPISECASQYAGSTNVEINDNVICASAPGRGMCSGDSGAPMVIDKVLVGLSSHFDHCTDKTNPDVFTRIDRYTDWILSVAVAPNSDAVGFRNRGSRVTMNHFFYKAINYPLLCI